MRKIFILFASLFMIALQLCADESTYLNFTAVNGPAYISLNKQDNPHDITLLYSTDSCATWTYYRIGKDHISLASGEKVYFKANRSGNSQFSDGYNYYYFFMTGTVAADGNIMSLLDETMTLKTVPSCAFRCLFTNCRSLIKAPALPAKNLSDDCYSFMFSGCTYLTTAPDLPANFLAPACYAGMFQGCRSLTKAPVLPAMSLAKWCYMYMFKDCTSLTEAPVLPASLLAEGCYRLMFDGCRSLTYAPALPETSLAEGCYESMFNGCTSLIDIPILPATPLVKNCYKYMFKGCSSLIVNGTSPGAKWIISASKSASDALYGMFENTGGTMNGTPIIKTKYYVASAPVYEVNVTANANDQSMGRVKGGGQQNYRNYVTLTAIPNNGYSFKHWSNGSKSKTITFEALCDTILTAYFEANAPSSINNTYDAIKVKLYPNPVRQGNGVFVHIEEFEGTTIEIITSDGLCLKKEETKSSVVYFDGLNTEGIYFARITDKYGNVSVIKFIVCGL